MEKVEFTPVNQEEERDDGFLNIDPDNIKSTEDSVESEQFIPYFTKSYKVIFGSPNYFVLIKSILVIYERVRLARKIIQDKVDEDFTECKESVIHDFKAYKKSIQRIQNTQSLGQEAIPDDLKAVKEGDEFIKECV